MSSGADRRKFEAAWQAANDDRTPDGQRAECFRFMAQMSQKYDTRAWKAELEAKHGPSQQTQQQAGQQSAGRQKAGPKKQQRMPPRAVQTQRPARVDRRRAEPRWQQRNDRPASQESAPEKINWTAIIILCGLVGLASSSLLVMLLSVEIPAAPPGKVASLPVSVVVLAPITWSFVKIFYSSSGRVAAVRLLAGGILSTLLFWLLHV